MNRKDFLKFSCSFCLLATTGITMSELLTSCVSTAVFKADITGNQIEVPVSEFTDKNLVIVRPRNFDYDIALRKMPNNVYLALLLQCTHAANQLVPEGKTGYVCNLHGSEFNIEGQVTKGPAARPLKRYNTQINNSNIKIILN